MFNNRRIAEAKIQGLTFVLTDELASDPAKLSAAMDAHSDPVRARLETYAQLADRHFNSADGAVRQAAGERIGQLLPGFNLSGVEQKDGVAQVSRAVFPVDITNDFMIMQGDISADSVLQARLGRRKVWDRFPIYHRNGVANPFNGQHAFTPREVMPGEFIRDFWGTLPIPGAQALIPRMAGFMREVAGLDSVPIAFLVDAHEVDDEDYTVNWEAAALFNNGLPGPWPYHNMIDTVGQQMVREVWEACGQRMETWTKKLFNGFHTDYARIRLKHQMINEAQIFGVASEICDTATALGALDIIVNHQRWPMSVVMIYDLMKALDPVRSKAVMLDLHKRGVFFTTSDPLQVWLGESHHVGNVAPSTPYMALSNAASLIRSGRSVAYAVDRILEYRPAEERVG